MCECESERKNNMTTEEKAAKWLIEVCGAEPHDIEERKSAVAYAAEMAATLGVDNPFASETITGELLVIAYGSSCMGNMAWETPYVILRKEHRGGKDFTYQSDMINPERIQGREAAVGSTITARIVVRCGRVKRFSWVTK
jgi:hypothetical protein